MGLVGLTDVHTVSTRWRKGRQGKGRTEARLTRVGLRKRVQLGEVPGADLEHDLRARRAERRARSRRLYRGACGRGSQRGERKRTRTINKKRVAGDVGDASAYLAGDDLHRIPGDSPRPAPGDSLRPAPGGSLRPAPEGSPRPVPGGNRCDCKNTEGANKSRRGSARHLNSSPRPTILGCVLHASVRR